MQSKTETDLKIFGFIENSFVDWDGMITSVIFLPGCNFRCPFCHNHELISGWEKLKDREVDSSHVLRILSDNTKWIDGLTVTGGEPTLQIGALVPFLKKVKKIGLKVKLDTNGINPSALRTLVDMKLVDHIAMDVKARIEAAAYSKASGVDIDIGKIKESIKFIMSSGIDHEFRTTVVPGLVSESDVADIAKDLKGCMLYALQKYHKEHAWKDLYRKTEPYSDDEMRGMEKSASEYVAVKLRLR
ncbi:MAG: anaerobic ribonucleoside-triphosphate reductase activating protein [Candidatus Aenigmarchaeota archaeon]|nr:anaerobic ribonucleoside-triphosphate reductase activating protein [Candidatus Aenigmarchaeota archaeon]